MTTRELLPLAVVQYPELTHFRQNFFTTKSTKDTNY
jgi:hypothetical protein